MYGRNNDGELPQDFGKNISQWQKEVIIKMKNNDPAYEYKQFQLHFNAGNYFTSDSEWKILGQYIAQNEYIRDMSIDAVRWDRPYRSMAPFLNNSPQLKTLKFGWNECIDKPCFDELMRLLDGKSIESLEFEKCLELDDISALELCKLPHLLSLHLHWCNLTQRIPPLKHCTSLKHLNLSNCNIGHPSNNSPPLVNLGMESNSLGDKGVEMLSNSLLSNVTLKTLSIEGEETILTEGAYVAFLKVLNDVTSINNTSQSNHTLVALGLPYETRTKEMLIIKDHVNSALDWNRLRRNKAIRKKVIDTQLNSKPRMQLCKLRGIGYCQSSIFAEIEQIILPEAISLVGEKYKHNELYQMLLAVVPGLVSVVDRKAVLKQSRAENLARMKALEYENARIEDELGRIESSIVQVQRKLSGKKRCR